MLTPFTVSFTDPSRGLTLTVLCGENWHWLAVFSSHLPFSRLQEYGLPSIQDVLCYYHCWSKLSWSVSNESENLTSFTKLFKQFHFRHWHDWGTAEIVCGCKEIRLVLSFVHHDTFPLLHNVIHSAFGPIWAFIFVCRLLSRLFLVLF